MIWAIVAIAVVALLGLLLRRGGKDDIEIPRTSPEQPITELDEDEEGPQEAVAITSDGWAFVPDGEEVQLIPPGEPEDVFPVRSTVTTGTEPSTDPDIQVMIGRGAPVNPKTGRRLPGWRPGDHLDAGDFIAARVVRGAPGVDPWRLEVLRRDRDYQAFPFETEEAARAAFDLVKDRIVRPPRDEHGDPIELGAADFATARAEHEATEAELASMAEEGEGDEELRR
jgi:hypothetical protein